ncbi:hypothetical protein HHFLNI_HHFLNI_04200, partial [Dysosmobacter welbionis]
GGIRGHHGGVRLRQDHPAEHPGGPGPPHRRGGFTGGQAPLCHPGAGSGGLPPVPPGVRVPGLQPVGHLLPSG